jgi:hypothetical protein
LVRWSQLQEAAASRSSAVRVCHGSVFAAIVAACAVCFSFRAMFRVCHDLLSVFGFGFSFFCDSRFCGVVVVAMYPLSLLLVRHAGVREVLTV